MKGALMRNFALIFVLLLNLSACSTNPSTAEIQTSSDITDVRRRANIRVQLAAAYLEADQASTALDEVKQALAIDSSAPDAYHIRALAYMKLNERALADQSFRRAIALKANDGDLLNNYGWFLCSVEKYDEAFNYFEQAQRTPSVAGPSKPLANAGICSLKRNDLANAESYLMHALRYDFNNSVANLALGQLYYKQGDAAKAQPFAQRVNNSRAASAESLWLGARIAHKLGDRNQQDYVVMQLRQRFPDSREAGALERGAWDE